MLEKIYFIFIISLIIQLLYYWLIFSRLAFYKKRNEKFNVLNAVSVIIIAKDEYDNLRTNLPLILEQDYPDFEVLVVNDCSEDDTDYLLKSLAEKYHNLKIINIVNNVNFFSGKKFPLSVGIKSAKNEILLLTDADCKPKTNQWIKEMQRNFNETTDIVLGYGPYTPSNGLLDKAIRLDTLFTAMQYFSFALSGLAYMGVGRNLAYKRSLFFKNKGFISHYRIMSGDDDLFINKSAKRNNVKIQISAESHTLSIPKTNFNDWFRQKKRHLSTGIYYKFKYKMLLGIYNLSLYSFFISFFILIIFIVNSQITIDDARFTIVLALFAFKIINQLFFVKMSMLKLNEKNMLLLSPFYEMFFLIYSPVLFLSNLIIKPNKWK